MNFIGSQPGSTHHFEMAVSGQRSLSSTAVGRIGALFPDNTAISIRWIDE